MRGVQRVKYCSKISVSNVRRAKPRVVSMQRVMPVPEVNTKIKTEFEQATVANLALLGGTAIKINKLRSVHLAKHVPLVVGRLVWVAAILRTHLVLPAVRASTTHKQLEAPNRHALTVPKANTIMWRAKMQ